MDRFEAAVAAIRVSGLSWSFAYASRRAGLHGVCSTGGERHFIGAVFEAAGGVGKGVRANARVRARGRY